MPVGGGERIFDRSGGEGAFDHWIRPFLRRQERSNFKEVGGEEVENRVINTYLGLDQTLRAGGYPPIVDFNLSDRTTAPAIPVEGAIERFRLIVNILENAPTETSEDWQTLKSELQGTVFYLSELQKPAEEQIGTAQAIREIMQAEPRIISDSELRSDQYELATLLNRDGFNCDPRDSKTMIRAFDRYKRRYYLRKRTTIKNRFIEAESRLRPVFIREIDLNLADLTYSINFVDKDEPYQAWARKDRDGFRVDLNLNERNFWGHGEMDRYYLHEVGGHLMMAYLHRRSIEEGKVSRALSIMPIPGARQYVFEGIAQTVHRGFPVFFPNLQLSLVARTSIIEYRLRMKLRTNALLKFDQGIDLGKIIDEYRQFYPMRTEEEIAKEIEEIKGSLVWKGYLPAYGLGDQEFSSIFKEIGGEDRKEFLRSLYRTPMTRSQVINSLKYFKLKQLPVWLGGPGS